MVTIWKSCVSSVVKYILTHNYFTFDQHIQEAPMGALDNFFMSWWKEALVHSDINTFRSLSTGRDVTLIIF